MTPGATILEGDLAAFGVFEVVAFLASSGHACVCEFRFDADRVKRVHFEAGDIVFATSTVTDDRLGESLLRAGGITRGQLDIAARAITPTNKLGKVLVEMGCLTPRGLYEAVRRQIEEIVESLFTFRGGRFVVTAGLPEGATRIRLSQPTRQFVLDAVGKTDAQGPPAAPPPSPVIEAAGELAPLIARYDQALSAITRVMRAHGVEPEERLADFVAGADSPRVALFQGVRLGAAGGLDVRRLVANATGRGGAAATGEPPAVYVEAGLEELFAYSLFAVQDLVEPAEAEALAGELRRILDPSPGEG